MKLTKQTLIEAIASMQDAEQRNRLLAKMVEDGDLNDADLAGFIVAEVNRNAKHYAALLSSDELVRFLAERFKDAPAYLARALVKVRPQLFWHYGFAYRLILRLRADLGTVFIPPRRASERPVEGKHPIEGLDALIAKDILALDIEHALREYLWCYSEDPDAARNMLRDDRAKADAYEQQVLDGVDRTFERLLAMEFSGVVSTLNGRLFPALHVRWWIDRMQAMPRVLNIGDTGTYKTSFGLVGLDHVGCRKVLVLCAANARQNHRREADRYFTDPGRAQVLERREDLSAFVDGFEHHQFHLVGWPALVRADVVAALAALPFDGIFVDECQYGKSVTGSTPAKRALALLRIGRKPSIRRVVACSATPWENRPPELAAVATLIRPDLFPAPEVFAHSGITDTPRVLRELFAENVLDVELREVRSLPDITPKPWEDLFGAVAIPFVTDHQKLYELLRTDESKRRRPHVKVGALLKAAIHPALVHDELKWPPALAARLRDWRLSSKLVWLKGFLDERIDRAKVVVGTGIFVSGITREKDQEMPWVGELLREWYGDDRVVILDATTAQIGPQRDAVIARWREDPRTRILLVSMLTCPDSINLTIPAHPSVAELWITTMSCAWKPWKQFLGRFWREGLGVPVRYRTPILAGTIDEDLLRFNREKWELQQLFRANVPLTDEEWSFLSADPGNTKLRELLRAPWQNVNLIGGLMQGRGEAACGAQYDAPYGVSTYAEIFAKHFLEVEKGSTAANIARYMAKHIRAHLDEHSLTSERIFDAGCGLLRLERTLELPVVGRDMNPHMIALGVQHSPCKGERAEVGKLSELPAEWTERFELTVCSLVLDWTSLNVEVTGAPERVHILRELCRVTHPYGQLWLTFTESTLDEKTCAAWCEVFRGHGFAIDRHLTGRVVATDRGADQNGKEFAFWSILVSPNGRMLGEVSADALQFPFEHGRVVVRHRRRSRIHPTNGERRGVEHEQFAIEPIGGTGSVRDTDAIEQSKLDEIRRWATAVAEGREVGRSATVQRDRYADLNWRALSKLFERGVLKVA